MIPCFIQDGAASRRTGCWAPRRVPGRAEPRYAAPGTPLNRQSRVTVTAERQHVHKWANMRPALGRAAASRAHRPHEHFSSSVRWTEDIRCCCRRPGGGRCDSLRAAAQCPQLKQLPHGPPRPAPPTGHRMPGRQIAARDARWPC